MILYPYLTCTLQKPIFIIRYMITIIDFHNFQKKRNKDIYMYLQYDEETIKGKSVISELSQRERERERGKERERERDVLVYLGISPFNDSCIIDQGVASSQLSQDTQCVGPHQLPYQPCKRKSQTQAPYNKSFNHVLGKATLFT